MGGNALVEAGTFLAILLGTLAGGALMALFVDGTLWVSVAVIGVALLGYAMSRAIPPVAASAPDLIINLNPFTQTVRTVACLRQATVPAPVASASSDERRVGNACVSTCSSRGAPSSK